MVGRAWEFGGVGVEGANTEGVEHLRVALGAVGGVHLHEKHKRVLFSNKIPVSLCR